MAVTSLIEMRRKAVKAGMKLSEARKSNRATLEDFLSNGSRGRTAAKKVVKKAVPVRKKKAPAKRSSGRTRAPAAKSTQGKAKRPAATRTRRNSNSDAGRATIGKLNYSITEGWNPREGSPVELIWRSLKKHRDDTDKVFAELRKSITKFVHAHKNNGQKRSKAEMEATLKYRINRTRFAFAIQTGQHESSTNRVEYGTGAYAQPKKSTRRASSTPKRSTKTTKQPAKRTPRKAPVKRTTTRKTKSAASRKRGLARR